MQGEKLKRKKPLSGLLPTLPDETMRPGRMRIATDGFKEAEKHVYERRGTVGDFRRAYVIGNGDFGAAVHGTPDNYTFDPETGLPVIAKISKIGPCVQIGDSAKEKPKFASLKKGQSIYSITLNDALELFRNSLPLSLGEYEGKEVTVGEGKYGPYVHYDKLFISIPRGKDPMSLKLEEAIALIDE